MPRLNQTQLATLKTLVLANTTAKAMWDGGNDTGVADWLNTPDSGIAWVSYFTWASMLSVLNWVEFIARTQSEQNALNTMFSKGQVNMGDVNTRSGITTIFSGDAQRSSDQRDSVISAAQRAMSKAEKALGVAGDNPLVYTLTFEGNVDQSDVSDMHALQS